MNFTVESMLIKMKAYILTINDIVLLKFQTPQVCEHWNFTQSTKIDVHNSWWNHITVYVLVFICRLQKINYWHNTQLKPAWFKYSIFPKFRLNSLKVFKQLYVNTFTNLHRWNKYVELIADNKLQMSNKLLYIHTNITPASIWHMLFIFCIT